MNLAIHLSLLYSKMAKAKGKNIILGILVLIVWGLIAVKILSYFKNGDSVEITEINPIKSAGIKISQDRFTIDASYSDPFLKSIKLSENKNRSVQPYNDYQENYQPTTIQVNWPEISYGGIVESSDKSRKVGLLKIDKSDFLIKEQDSIKNIKVLNIYKDSILLRNSSMVKSFSIKKEK